jgi:hypothetical protein
MKCITISFDAEKAVIIFLTTYQLFMITVNKLGAEGNYLNIISTILKNSQGTSYLMSKDFKLPLTSGTRKGCLILFPLFNIVLEVLDRVIRQEKRNATYPYYKGRSKIISFTDDI